MASTTWNVSKDARIAYRTSDGWEAGSGTSDGLPVGLYSGYRYRTLLGFSYSFTGMTAITAATLNVKTSSQIHVAFGSDPDIYIARLTESWSEGSSSGLSASNAVTWANQPAHTNTNRVLKDISTVEGTWVAIDITDLVIDAFNAGTFYGVKLYSSDESATSETTEFYSSEYSTSSDAYITVTYSTNTAPNAPTLTSPIGGAVVNSLTPTFQGTFSDPDSGDTMSGYQIIVYASDGTTVKWDSGTIAGSGTTFSKVYSGAALTGNTTYKWKARTKDAAGAWGAYSAQASFVANSVPNAPSISLGQSPTTDVKTLTPTFNVTHSDPDPADSQMYAYRIVVETSGGTAVWDTGDIAVTATVSKTVTYAGPALSWQTGYRWKARTKDSNGAWSNYSGYATFTTHTTGVPISLSPTGSATASSTTPTLTGSRGNTSDSLTSAEVEVYASNGTTLVWGSGTFTTGVSSTAFSKVTGTTLTAATTYKWRARVTSSVGGTSAWSALQTFVTPAADVATPTTPEGTGITDTTPDFTFTRATNFNRHQLYLYSEDDGFTTAIWSDTPVAYTATASKTVTSGVTLEYGKTYRWKVRVSADGGTNWSSYTGDTQFTMDIAGVPTLTAPINSSWETSLTPTFTGTTYNAETIATFRIKLYAADQTTLVWDSGDIAGSGTSFSKVYNGSTALTKGSVYYWKASYKKTGSIPGGESALEDFHINADPSAPTGLSPATGTVVADSLTPTFKATFADADLTTYGDTPTEYKVEVYRNSDSVLMHTLTKTTSLVAGQNSIARTTEGTALSYEVEYKARFRYKDSKSATGSWSSYVVFKPSQSPTTSISAPGATVNSPSFTISWAMTSPGGKAQESYRVRVIRQSDDVVVYDTTKVASTTTSFVLPGGYLQNATAYTIEVTTWDTDDLGSTPDTATTTTDWTAPDTVSDFAAVSDPATSTMLITWTESNLPGADFSHYQLYRREAGDDQWTKYATISSQSTTSYNDYYAANGVTYDYMMTVFQSVPGDVDLESPDSDISSAVLDADVWFVIGADRSADHSFELPVSDESHSEPIQQEVFEPLGSRRKTIVRGKVLGAEGVLDVRWTSTERVAAKAYVRYITDNQGPHILKSPFGDVWDVEFAGPSNKYAGGGHVAVTLTWIEVD